MDEKLIPEEIFLYMMQYLDPIDCMSFALSSVSKRFSTFYLRRQSKWELRYCFGVNPDLCIEYLTSRPVSAKVVSLDLNHCFWLTSHTLLSSLVQLRNITELRLIDSPLNITHVPDIGKYCPKIVRLSITVVERTWAEFLAKFVAAQIDNFKEVFGNLTWLKLHILDANSPNIWLLIFRVLRWCAKCTELYLELFYSTRGCPLEYKEQTDSVIDFSRQNLYEELKWIVNLTTLAYSRRGCQGYNDGCFDDWCQWILNELKPNGLQHIWLPFVANVKFDHPTSSVKSFFLGRNVCQNELDSVMPEISHLGGVSLSSFSQLPHLRLFQGSCSSYPELDRFCQKHGLRLEYLHFDDESQACRASPTIFQCQWALPRLRALIYASRCPHAEILKKLTVSCPNLEELHLGRRSSSYYQAIFDHQEADEEAYTSIANLKRLKKLTISGVKFNRGHFLQQVLQSCRSLQSLHISGQFDGDFEFHRDLCSALRYAQNLREFRLQREELQDSQLLDLLSSIGSCSRLERLVIYQEAWSAQSNSLSNRLPKVIVRLVRQQLPRLTAFCLVYPLHSNVVEVTAGRLDREVKTTRPAFWFHLADELPRGTDSRVPRIHYDQIVDPDYSADFLNISLS